MKQDDKIQMKDLTPNKRAILESKLLKEGVVPNICEGKNGYATMIIPADENTCLSGAAAALLPFQDEQNENDRLQTAMLCANQVLNIALILHNMTEESCCANKEYDIVANSFLQRALSYHISNIKLTSEGIYLQSKDSILPINDNYKAIPLTRSVYELLVTFFGLFILNDSEEKRIIAFNCWKINSEKNVLGELDLTNDRIVERQNNAIQTIEDCKSVIFSTTIGNELQVEISKYLARKSNGTIYFQQDNNKETLKTLSFSSAWKFMTKNDTNQTFLYRMLSMHSHPIYWGLSQFVNQSGNSISDAILGLHFSSVFLAKLCSYYNLYFDFEDVGAKLTAHQQGVLKSMSEAI